MRQNDRPNIMALGEIVLYNSKALDVENNGVRTGVRSLSKPTMYVIVYEDVINMGTHN